MRISTNHDAILVGTRECAHCNYLKNYDPFASSTRTKIKQEYKEEIINQGKIDVMLWQDKVCIYSEKNCMPTFQFQT